MRTFLTISVILFHLIANSQIYKANSVFQMQANGKNTGKIAGDIGLFGINPKVSYSFWENYSLSTNFNVFKDDETELFYAEISGGYYKKMWGKGVFELNFGAGYGKANGNINVYSDDLFINNSQDNADLINSLPTSPDNWGEILDIYTSNNILRFHAQPGIGYSSKFIELSFAMRISLINSNISEPYQTKNTMLFAEPVGTFSFGYDALMVYMQTGFSTPIYMSHDHAFLSYEPVLLSMGFALRLGTLCKKNSLLD